MQVDLFDGRPDEWDAFVAATPHATASHLYAWRRIISRVYQHDCPYLAARNSAGIAGVLPLVDVRSLAFGRYLVSMPFLNAGGPIGSAEAIRALTGRAVQLGHDRRVRLLEFRAGTALDVDLDYAAEKIECRLQLPNTGEELWRGFPAKLRSQIRRAQKANIEMRFGEDQVEPFFTVFSRNMRDLGSPTHPQRFFAALLEEMPDTAMLGVAYYAGKPVAGGCALRWQGEVEMTWASALREYSTHAPNMLLYWAFMERAIETGARTFNFGRCTPGTGSHRFKAQWGTADRPLHWYRAALRDGAATPKQEGGLSLATRLWQYVPVPLATLVGARLRGGIPA